MNKLLKLLGVAAISLLLAACGGNKNNSTPPANLRFVNAAQNDSLTLSLNGSPEFSGIAPASTSSYASVTAGNYTISVTGATGTVVSPAFTFSLSGGLNYSLIAYVRNGAVITTLLSENQTVPTAGYGTLGMSNMSPDSGALDLYLVAPGTTDLSGLAPLFQSAVFKGSPVWTTLVAGTFDVIVTAAGNQNDVRMKLPSVTISGGQVLMLGFTSAGAGALVDGIVLTQGGSVQLVNTTYARVRVVSALPVAGASSVNATVGGVNLAPVFAPNPGTYTLVVGGTSTYSISVAGTPIASVPAATFTAGGDFTVLVYGAVATPAVAVFTDNNQLPVVGGDVKLRLINAAINVPGGLTLYDNSVEVASAVGYGQASPYFGVATSSQSTLELIEPSVAPTFTTIPLSPAGSVYSVFVIDNTLTPFVIRDR
ncbi:MAG TPA: DUF4397 domain-containing protein [Burkholderiaceae bacterium]|nr:DUF4397 domain-containing protein [Burkholderiaceae bacterium]